MKKIFLAVAMVFMAMAGYAQGFGERQLLNDDWSFYLGDGKYLGAEFYDHSEWRVLDLPHDWSVEMPASPELASCTGYLPGGIAWYRRFLDVPAEKAGKKVYIYFEGVYNNSDVFINGKWIGKRPNGYISFMYDLTPYINFGGRNVIAVRVDHSQDADSRWYTGSGIYRDVYMVYSDPVHINQWGVSYSAKINGSRASVDVKTEVKNNTAASQNVEVLNSIRNAEGKTVATGKYSLKAGASSVTSGHRTLTVRNPELWDLDHPYLYTIHTEIRVKGRLTDSSDESLGLRTLTFDPDKGFSLNGKNMKVKGLCIHHDAGCLGSAVPAEVWRERLLQLKAIGCNAIRLSHNPQAPCVYDICDEIGLLVKDEAFDEWEYPKKKWIEGWNVGTPGFQGSAHYFREWCKTDLGDMIRRDRNHPSIILWSIGNEVDYPNDPYSHPVLDEAGISQYHVKGYQTSQPRAERLGEIAKDLVAEAKKYDTSRPVTAALAGAVMSNETDYPFVLDVVGYNYTEDRYAMDHEKYPDRVLYGSETRHDLEAWKAVRDNDFIFGQFIWTGMDYLGEAGPWPSRGFTTGMLDLTGAIKPGGYFRRALWAESPVAYLGTYISEEDWGDWVAPDAPQVWNYEEGEQVRVVTYTNCTSAELWLNGKLVGERKPYDDSNAIIWWDLPYAPGTLEVKAYIEEELAATDKIVTTGLPYAITASLNKEKYQVGEFAMVRISVLDEHGNLVVLADNEITCEVEGPASIIAVESGEGNAADNFRDNVQRCKNGSILAYVKIEGEGPVSMSMKSPLLKSCHIVINK